MKPIIVILFGLCIQSFGCALSQVHRRVFNATENSPKVLPKHPYIKALRPGDQNQELCYCVGSVCYYCPEGLYCNIDDSGCCPMPGCHDDCGELCVCPLYPTCCDDVSTCPIGFPVCCDNHLTCCPAGADCCGLTLCCNSTDEKCCQDSEGNYYCGNC